MTTATAKSSEPTIDDILASIRRIIADEQQAEEAPQVATRVMIDPQSNPEDVLDLAQPVLRPVNPPPPAQVQAVAAPAPLAAPQAEAIVASIPPKPAETTLRAPKPANESKPAASADGARLEKLIAGEAEEALAAAFGRISALKVSAETRTLEGLVADLLRPMLKEWLDANLPAIAERLVKQEIERIAAQAGR